MSLSQVLHAMYKTSNFLLHWKTFMCLVFVWPDSSFLDTENTEYTTHWTRPSLASASARASGDNPQSLPARCQGHNTTTQHQLEREASRTCQHHTDTCREERQPVSWLETRQPRSREKLINAWSHLSKICFRENFRWTMVSFGLKLLNEKNQSTDIGERIVQVHLKFNETPVSPWSKFLMRSPWSLSPELSQQNNEIMIITRVLCASSRHVKSELLRFDLHNEVRIQVPKKSF